jgi:hypothetical protein
MLEDHRQFPDQSRVWIYQADRLLDQTEQNWILEQLETFVPTWANHGKHLTATAFITNDCQIVLVVNEAMIGASGCSIDSSVRFIKELGKALNVDFFNRLLTFLVEEKEFIHYHDRNSKVGAVYADTLVSNLGEYRSSFIKTLK